VAEVRAGTTASAVGSRRHAVRIRRSVGQRAGGALCDGPAAREATGRRSTGLQAGGALGDQPAARKALGEGWQEVGVGEVGGWDDASRAFFWHGFFVQRIASYRASWL
jgi:hypothetical protein